MLSFSAIHSMSEPLPFTSLHNTSFIESLNMAAFDDDDGGGGGCCGRVEMDDESLISDTR